MVPQHLNILGGQVGEPAVLGPAPDALVGVEVRGIAREVLRHHVRVRLEEGLDHLGLAVDRVLVPDHRQRPQGAAQLAQELHHALAGGVVVQHPEVQVEPTPHRAERNATDGRQPIAAIPAVQHRGLATRRQRPPHRWRQEEAGLVAQQQIGVPVVGLPKNAWKFISDPSLDLLVVTLPRSAPGLLAGPAEPLLEKAADVLGVVGQAKEALDQAGDASGRPQLIVPAVELGSVQEQLLQLLQLVVAQPWSGAQLRLGPKAVRLLGLLQPAGQGLGMDAQDMSHCGARLTLLDEGDRTPSSPLQLRCCSNGSTHTTLDAHARAKGTLPALDPVNAAEAIMLAPTARILVEEHLCSPKRSLSIWSHNRYSKSSREGTTWS